MSIKTELIVVPYADEDGKPVTRINNVIALFDSDFPRPPVDVPVSVLITGVANPRRKHGEGYEASRARFIVLRVVTPDMMLVKHEGFYRDESGTRYSTANVRHDGVCFKLNANRTGVVSMPAGLLRPGVAYISRSWYDAQRRDLPEGESFIIDRAPIIGIVDPQELDYLYRS